MDKDFILEITSTIKKEVENLHELMHDMQSTRDEKSIKFKRANMKIPLS